MSPLKDPVTLTTKPLLSLSLRRTALASALLLGLQAHALTLGRLHVLSHVGEPLRAEVSLEDIDDDLSHVRFSVVPATAYSQLGQNNNALAKGFTLSWVQDASGAKLLLSSSQPMSAAFVDFVIEAQWPAGRSTRDYTALFSEPANTAVPVVVSPSTEPSTGLAATGSVPGAEPANGSPARVMHLVKAGETAGQIAQANRLPETTVEQMLVALLRENPQAFIDQNVNQLRAGTVLQLPQAASVQRLPQAQALALLQVQHTAFQAWRERLAQNTPSRVVPAPGRESTGDITPATPTAPTPAVDRLTLSQEISAGGSTEPTKQGDQAAAQTARDLETQDLKQGNRAIASQIDALDKLSQETLAQHKAENTSTAKPDGVPEENPEGKLDNHHADQVKAPAPGEGATTAQDAAGNPASAASEPTPGPGELINSLVATPWVPGVAGGLLLAMAGLAALRIRQRRQPHAAPGAPTLDTLDPLPSLAADVSQDQDTVATSPAWQAAAPVDDPSLAPMSALPPGLPDLNLDLNLDLAPDLNPEPKIDRHQDNQAALETAAMPADAPAASDLLNDDAWSEPQAEAQSATAFAPLPLDLGGLSLDLDVPNEHNAGQTQAGASADPAWQTKLDLAQEFLAMGDQEGARTLVDEVLAQSTGEARARAQAMLFDLA